MARPWRESGRKRLLDCRKELGRTDNQFCPMMLAGGQGFEPHLADPESAVLPLDDPPTTESIISSGLAQDKMPTAGKSSSGAILSSTKWFSRISRRRLTVPILLWRELGDN